jgi:hypothetical protein
MSFLTGRARDGQVMVQVAMLMVVFFAFMAIAIDVGHMLNERRRMQNAADAGALAGAWELCFGVPAQAEATAREYAIDRNGAEVADVSVGELRVTVYARESTGLYLARLFGIQTADINARAVAACGAAISSCGIWPIAFPEEDWLTMYDEGAGCAPGDEEDFYVWTGHQKNKSPDCNVCECDLDGDKDVDVVGMIDEDGDHAGLVGIWGRAFLDFGDDADAPYEDCRQPGCGEAELACWIESTTGGQVSIPACIPGTNGVRAGLKDEVDDRARLPYPDNIVGIPLYDQMGCTEAHPDPGYCPGGERFHVVDIGCVKVVGWVHQLKLDYKDDYGGGRDCWKDKAILVTMACDGCETECGSTNGDIPLDWEMRAVSLIE